MSRPTVECYEIPNTFTNDWSLDKQIEEGVNDWCCEDSEGRKAFGRTEAEARANYAAAVPDFAPADGRFAGVIAWHLSAD